MVKDEDVPEMLLPPRSQIVPRNSVVRVDCVFGGPETPVEWIFKEETLRQNNPRYDLLSFLGVFPLIKLKDYKRRLEGTEEVW